MARTAPRRRLAVALVFTTAGTTPVVALGVAGDGQGAHLSSVGCSSSDRGGPVPRGLPTDMNSGEQ